MSLVYWLAIEARAMLVFRFFGWLLGDGWGVGGWFPFLASNAQGPNASRSFPILSKPYRKPKFLRPVSLAPISKIFKDSTVEGCKTTEILPTASPKLSRHEPEFLPLSLALNHLNLNALQRKSCVPHARNYGPRTFPAKCSLSV